MVPTGHGQIRAQGVVGRIYKGVYLTLLHTNYKSSMGLRPIYKMFFKFLPISFQRKIMMICGFDSNNASKIPKFC